MNNNLNHIQKEYIKEIEHKFNPEFYYSHVGAYERFLNSLFDIKISGIEKIKDSSENAVFKYVLPHKSHLDYVIISCIFAEEDIKAPRILAGNNLFFFPFDLYIRKMGAIKVPRKGSREKVLASIHYVKQQFLEENDILNFPEGGRSKQGHLKKYKNAYFQAAIEAQLENPDLNLYIMPVSTVYERVPEDLTLQRSAKLAEKSHKIKDITDFISVVLSPVEQIGQRKSIVYLDFGTLIPVAGFIDGNPGYEPRELGKKLADFTREQTLKNYRVVSTSLLAKSIKSIDGYMEKPQIIDEAQKLFEFLEGTGTNVENISEYGLEESIEIGIEHFANRRKKVLNEENGRIIIVRPDVLEFYANSISHFWK